MHPGSHLFANPRNSHKPYSNFPRFVGRAALVRCHCARQNACSTDLVADLCQLLAAVMMRRSSSIKLSIRPQRVRLRLWGKRKCVMLTSGLSRDTKSSAISIFSSSEYLKVAQSKGGKCCGGSWGHRSLNIGWSQKGVPLESRTSRSRSEVFLFPSCTSRGSCRVR